MSYDKRRQLLRGWPPDVWARERAVTGDHCRLCGSHTSRPNADHCHRTHRPRGLLCQTCNLRIGHVERYLRAVALNSRFVNHNAVSIRWYHANQARIDLYLSTFACG